MARSKRKSRILSEAYESAQDLHKAGLIDDQRMRKFDALCRPSLQEMSPQKIKVLRKRANLTQAVFADVLNISVSTVQKWEVGDKKPRGASLKLLNLIESKGVEVLL